MPGSKVARHSRLDVARRPLAWAKAFLCGLCLLPWGLAAVAEGGFFDLLEDLPLMPGLAEVREAGVVFDKPDGRIVEAYASGDVARDSVFAFYRAALPELGWGPIGASRWRREGEYLHLLVSQQDETVTLRITITPD